KPGCLVLGQRLELLLAVPVPVGVRRLHLVGVELVERRVQAIYGLSVRSGDARLSVKRSRRAVVRHERNGELAGRARLGGDGVRVTVDRRLRSWLAGVTAIGRYAVGDALRRRPGAWCLTRRAGVANAVFDLLGSYRPQHVRTAVLAVLRAWAVGGVAVALHHLHEVEKRL